MWTNSMLKENARNVLRKNYFVALIATAIVMALTGGLSLNFNAGASGRGSTDALESYLEEYLDEYSENSDSDYDYDDYYDDYGGYEYDYDDYFAFSADPAGINGKASDFEDFLGSEASTILRVAAVTVIIAFLIGIAYNIFFANVLRVGHNRFYLDLRWGNAGIGGVFSQFSNGYGSAVKTMFVMNLKLFLWGLLSIIPVVVGTVMFIGKISEMDFDSIPDHDYEAIMKIVFEFIGTFSLIGLVSLLFAIPQMIKQYEYFLVPYLIAENPSIGCSRAFEISRKVMKGEKLHLFGLQMSFIGWYLLAGFAAGIAALLPFIGPFIAALCPVAVMPYLYATQAEFYCCMREKAMATGISDSFELNGVFGSFHASAPYPQQNTYDPYQSYQQTNVNSSGTYPADNSQTNNGYSDTMNEVTFTGSANTTNEAPSSDIQDNGGMPDISYPNPISLDSEKSDDDYKGPEIE